MKILPLLTQMMISLKIFTVFTKTDNLYQNHPQKEPLITISMDILNI